MQNNFDDINHGHNHIGQYFHILLLKATCYKTLEQWHQSIQECNRALLYIPDRIDEYGCDKTTNTICILMLRGMCYRKLEIYEKAADDYSAVLISDTSSIRALNNRAYCYARLGMYYFLLYC
jgi:tetratricopeptide (TPR) repeat protein